MGKLSKAGAIIDGGLIKNNPVLIYTGYFTKHLHDYLRLFTTFHTNVSHRLVHS